MKDVVSVLVGTPFPKTLHDLELLTPYRPFTTSSSEDWQQELRCDLDSVFDEQHYPSLRKVSIRIDSFRWERGLDHSVEGSDCT
jgi:hypothetical protein